MVVVQKRRRVSTKSARCVVKGAEVMFVEVRESEGGSIEVLLGVVV